MKERLRKTLSQVPTPQRSNAIAKEILTPDLAIQMVEGRVKMAVIMRKAD